MRLFTGFVSKDTAKEDLLAHVNSQYVLVWLLDGSGWYEDRQGRQALAAGDLVQRLPGRRHSTWSAPDRTWIEFFLALDPPFHRLLDQSGIALCRQPVLHPGLDLSLVERCAAFVEQVRRASPDDGGRLLRDAHVLVHDWHALHAARTQQPQRTAVLRACRLLESDPSRLQDLPAVARQVGLGYERFRKIFAAQMGQAPGAWMRARRLDAARALLLESRASVAAVAGEVGYASPAAFIRHFRLHMGTTPGRWRRQPVACRQDASDVRRASNETIRPR